MKEKETEQREYTVKRRVEEDECHPMRGGVIGS